ncbi:apolipoprotein N-acyltransferase [Advenella sp. RU8]|uniref:apolipoprotein N-acyltransferase n=1 Tax=Advenella sp. RU8 TaxID=3399575 RepID=UPI003AAFF310
MMHRLLLLAAGVLHALSFSASPLPAWSLSSTQIITLAILAWYVLKANSIRQAAWSAAWFSISNFCTGIYWLFISMNTYGALAAPLAATAVFLLSAYLSLYPVLAAGITRYLSRNHIVSFVLVWAGSMALSEWLRSFIFTGFPWNSTGYAHTDSVLSGWAPVLGAYGVGFMAALVSALLVACLAFLQKAQPKKSIFCLASIAGVFIISLGLKQIAWHQPHGNPISIRLVQGNISQDRKFHPDTMMESMNENFDLALLEPADPEAPPKVIIFPETIIPGFQNRMSPHFWQSVAQLAEHTQSVFFMGVPLHTLDHRGERVTNSVIALDGNTSVEALMSGLGLPVYDKQHLVPFGEFIPYGFRWFVHAIGIPLGDFDRGTSTQRNFVVQDQVFAPNICYEDVFGEELLPALFARPDGSPGASILFNVSNLAWFGNTFALGQHLQIARMRSMETARPMVRATNTGTTAAIDASGNLIAALPTTIPGVLDVQVQGTQGYTLYARAGNSLVLVLSLLCIGLGVFFRKKP